MNESCAGQVKIVGGKVLLSCLLCIVLAVWDIT